MRTVVQLNDNNDTVIVVNRLDGFSKPIDELSIYLFYPNLAARTIHYEDVESCYEAYEALYKAFPKAG